MNLPLFPLHTVLFPGMALPLHIFEPRYRKLVDECLSAGSPFGVVLIRSGVEVGRPANPFPVGTLARISRVERLPDGRMNIEAVGQERFRIRSLDRDSLPHLVGAVDLFPLAGPKSRVARQAALAFGPYLARYLELLSQAAATQMDPRRLPHEPAQLAYLAAIVVQIPMSEKQELLSVDSAPALLLRERAIFRREISLLRAMLVTAKAYAKAPICPN